MVPARSTASCPTDSGQALISLWLSSPLFQFFSKHLFDNFRVDSARFPVTRCAQMPPELFDDPSEPCDVVAGNVEESFYALSDFPSNFNDWGCAIR